VAKENFCKDVIVQAKENARLISELMADWLGCAWELWPGALSMQCMHFMAISLIESETGWRTKTLI
jgi:hypothetical protein